MRKPFLTMLVIIALGGGAYYIWNATKVPAENDQPPNWVSSTDLKSTQIMPSIDTPLMPGRSAIWCASFQLAWDKLCDDVNGAPVIIQDAEEICERLNRSTFDPKHLVKDSYYVNAGLVPNGMWDTIRHEMRTRFPNQKLPPLEINSLTNAVAYAYLEANLKFGIPYFADDLTYQDSIGKRTKVRAFGFTKKHHSTDRSPWKQVGLLFATMSGFALDLDKHSSPHQIVVARIEPQETLAGTWKYVRKLINEDKNASKGAPIDQILVPKMNWGVHHRVAEVERKVIKGGRLKDDRIVEALQSTRFSMNEHGAHLASEARIVTEAKSIPQVFNFERPFLIAMLKRGATEPFFLMWVDNAELMME